MQKSFKPFWITAALCLTVAFLGCDQQKTETSAPEVKLPADHYFQFTLDGKTLDAQLALSEPEMRRGLMHRKAMDENKGMLFVYQDAAPRSFWMKNTYIPLDIGFFDNKGVLREVYPMYPLDETSVRSSSDLIKFALEMNQGWFASNNISPGVKLDLEAVKEAVSQRGFDPTLYRFE